MRSIVLAGYDARRALTSPGAAVAATDGVHERDGEWTRVGLAIRSESLGPDIALRSTVDVIANPSVLDGTPLHLSFLDFQRDGALFDDLEFEIWGGGELLRRDVLENADSIDQFFDSVITLDPLRAFDGSVVYLSFVLQGTTTTKNASLGTYFAIGSAVVPEPNTVVLIGLGLIGLAAPRTRPKRTRPKNVGSASIIHA